MLLSVKALCDSRFTAASIWHLSKLPRNGDIGRNPYTARVAVVDDIECIKRFVEFAFLAVTENSGFDGGKGRMILTRGDEVTDNFRPKASEGFVVATVFGVLAANGDVVKRDAFAHAAEGFGGS